MHRHHPYCLVCLFIAVMSMLMGCNDSADPQQQAHELFEQSKQYDKKNDIDGQTSALLQAYRLLPQFDEPSFASKVCQALGSAYMYRKLFNQSLDYCRQAVSYALQEKPHSKQLTLSYSHIGRTFAEMHEADSALFYFEKALSQATLLRDTTEIGVGFAQLGAIYELNKDYDNAIEYTKRGLDIYILHGDTNYIPQAYYGIGSTYYYMNELDSAKTYFEKALRTDNIYTIQGSYQALYHINRKQGKLEEAIEYNQKSNQLKDSITTMANNEMLAELQAKYENEKLLNQQASLKLRNLSLSLFLTISILAIVIIVIVGSQLYRYKQRKLEESRLKLDESERIIHKNQKEINRLSQEIDETSKTFNEKANLIMVQNGLLQKQNENLISFFRKNEPILQDLEKHPKAIKDWQHIYQLTDTLQMNCYSRLRQTFPKITEGSINICCLIRLGFSNSQIALMVAISPESLAKRKGRIRDELMNLRPDMFSHRMPLDEFIGSF